MKNAAAAARPASPTTLTNPPPLSGVVPVRKTRGADVVVAALVRAGVRTVFGVPGGPIAPVFDALLDEPSIRLVTTRIESTAVFAAAGYARVSGEPVVCLFTSGPGVLNCLTGLASAHREGLPVLVLVGEAMRSIQGRNALQDGSAHGLDIVGMTRHLAKLVAEVRDWSSIPAMIEHARRTMLSGARGPALLTLPMDVLLEQGKPPSLDSAAPMPVSRCDGEAFANAARMLSASTRGLIVAGSGARWGDAPKKLLELATRLGMPVVTTPKAKGIIPDSSPLALGGIGVGGHPSAYEYIAGGLDTVLVVGSSLGELATDGWRLPLHPSDAFIQIDIDPSRIGHAYPVTAGLVADASSALDALIEHSEPVERKAALPPRRYHEMTTPARAGRVHPREAIERVQQLVDGSVVYCSDIGDHLTFALHYLRIGAEDDFIVQAGLGSMASGIGAAIGAQLAAPERQIVCICGDGGAMMALADFAVAATESLPILFVVFNNARWGMVESGCAAIFGREHGYPIEGERLFATLTGLGVDVIDVRAPADFEKARPAIARRHGPIVLNVHVDPSLKIPNPRNRTFGGANGASAAGENGKSEVSSK